ncbi:hypothetical protein L873DRAFT_113868 [Choiromyces venosus 120613-1]|uniref:Uncharacterized protein n=1 Tax=Choiromyces venosus 120613-1 TaxID=1336337 RepID=A0A3N4JGV1_9PEZI|nr:hypothetical protein L873DRAFT_113868 [Choiromyces venosus 120613-1]
MTPPCSTSPPTPPPPPLCLPPLPPPPSKPLYTLFLSSDKVFPLLPTNPLSVLLSIISISLMLSSEKPLPFLWTEPASLAITILSSLPQDISPVSSLSSLLPQVSFSL